MKLYEVKNSGLLKSTLYVIADSCEQATQMAREKYKGDEDNVEISSVLLLASENKLIIRN